MRGVRIRAGVLADAAAFAAVQRASIDGLATPHYTPEEAASWADGLAPAVYLDAMLRGERFLVAERRGAVAGFCSFRDDEIVGLYVRPEQARRGIARALLARAEAAIAAAGIGRIRLCASLPGRAFYEAAGYRAVGEKSWSTRGGLTIRVVEMERRLGPGD